jgi:glycosyltransferase involved in cell wall biosynthesis
MSSLTAESTAFPSGVEKHVARPPYVYVLVTPARNEADFIEQTIKSVVAQTIRPAKWVIVSDGSTDGTDEIVKRYALSHQWIELLRMPERTERDFAGKIHAFNAGLARVKDIRYDLVCSLDADITFGEDYFEFLLGKFAENPRLGLAGTPHVENNRTYDFRFASIEHVSGACQLFRRECFEAIGGYVPIKSGGVDLVAVLSARLKGWQTRTFLERTCEHHRKMGSATKHGLAVTLHDGRKDYLLGAHPLWEIFRGTYRFARPPYIIGGACLLWGYFWPMLLREPRTAPREVVAFRHKEQAQRLRAILRKFWFRSPETANRNN